jgi:hydrogenase 3 maturation protease
MNESDIGIKNSVEDELHQWFSKYKRIVIVGIGNPLRKDDYVGVMIVRKLKGNNLPHVHLFECETVPESFMQQIIELKPSHILIIDAAILNINPGNYRLVKPDELLETQAVSTHMLPLRIFCQYLINETKAEMILLLIQPKDVSFGEGITPELEKTVTHTAKLLQKTLGEF